MGKIFLALILVSQGLSQASFAAGSGPGPRSINDEPVILTCPGTEVLAAEPAALEAEWLRAGGIAMMGAGAAASGFALFVSPQEMTNLKKDQAVLETLNRYLRVHAERRVLLTEFRGVKTEIRRLYREHGIAERMAELRAQGVAPSLDRIFEGRPGMDAVKQRLGQLNAKRATLYGDYHLAKKQAQRAISDMGRVIPTSYIPHATRYEIIAGKAEDFGKRVGRWQSVIESKQPFRSLVAGGGIVGVVGGLVVYAASEALGGLLHSALGDPEAMTDAELAAMDQIVPCIADQLGRHETKVGPEKDIVMRHNGEFVPLIPYQYRMGGK